MAYITSEEVKEIRNEIKAAFPKNFNYFHVGFYTRIEVGKWDKPYVQSKAN